MTQYLISFDGDAMDHIPEEDMPAVGRAAHEVVQEALNAGVYLFAGGLEFQRPIIVATDGTVTDGRRARYCKSQTGRLARLPGSVPAAAKTSRGRTMKG